MSKKKKRKIHNVWRLWSYSLGEKHGKDDQEADIISSIRTFIFFTYLITNVFIVAGNIRHWNDIEYTKKGLKLDCIVLKQSYHQQYSQYKDICNSL
jgi:hypothetical protein